MLAALTQRAAVHRYGAAWPPGQASCLRCIGDTATDAAEVTRPPLPSPHFSALAGCARVLGCHRSRGDLGRRPAALPLPAGCAWRRRHRRQGPQGGGARVEARVVRSRRVLLQEQALKSLDWLSRLGPLPDEVWCCCCAAPAHTRSCHPRFASPASCCWEPMLRCACARSWPHSSLPPATATARYQDDLRVLCVCGALTVCLRNRGCSWRSPARPWCGAPPRRPG